MPKKPGHTHTQKVMMMIMMMMMMMTMMMMMMITMVFDYHGSSDLWFVCGNTITHVVCKINNQRKKRIKKRCNAETLQRKLIKKFIRPKQRVHKRRCGRQTKLQNNGCKLCPQRLSFAFDFPGAFPKSISDAWVLV